MNITTLSLRLFTICKAKQLSCWNVQNLPCDRWLDPIQRGTTGYSMSTTPNQSERERVHASPRRCWLSTVELLQVEQMPICMWPRVKGIVEVPGMKKGNDLVYPRNNVIAAWLHVKSFGMKWWKKLRKENDQKYLWLQMAWGRPWQGKCKLCRVVPCAVIPQTSEDRNRCD